jgi:hypothetical protein
LWLQCAPKTVPVPLRTFMSSLNTWLPAGSAEKTVTLSKYAGGQI